MKKEQLIDAIGMMDDAVLSGIDPAGAGSADPNRAKVSGKTLTQNRRFRIILIAVAIMVMIGGSVAVAAGPVGGKLNTGKKTETADGGEMIDHEYVAYGDARVDTADIRGGVNSDMKQIPERMENHSMFSSKTPNSIDKSFTSIAEAVKYIGYAKLNFPELSYPYENIHTETMGFTDDEERKTDYRPGVIILQTGQKYHSEPDYWFDVSAHIYTTDYPYPETVGIRTAVSDQATYTSEEKEVGGRTFSIVRQEDPSFSEGHQLCTDVFWQENGVFYYFHIVYREDLREEAEKVAQEWMESFR